MIEAISYKRFSSTIQLGGDSLRRQIVVTEAYCKRQPQSDRQLFTRGKWVQRANLNVELPCALFWMRRKGQS
jgi:hypothetical protein